MVVSETIVGTSHPQRRRRNSLASISDFSSRSKPRALLHRPATENSNLLELSELPKPTRFRRSSFALVGERNTALDGFVQEAAAQTVQMVASREADRITNIVSSSSGLGENSIVNTDSDTPFRKASIATMVGAPVNSSDASDRPVFTTSSDTTSQNVREFNLDEPEKSTKDKFVWHNTKAFTQNPLSSELVKKYLAMVAITGPTEDSEVLRRNSPHPNSQIACRNLPGFVQLATPAVASMTIPVHQIQRAHAARTRFSSTVRPGCPSSCKSYPPSFAIHLGDRNACTDASGLSDAEHWPLSSHQLGYQSDSPVIDGASEAKQLILAGKRLEADFHWSTSSLPRPKKNRSRSKLGAPQLHVLPSLTTPPSVHSSKFDLVHVYEGLPVPTTTGPTWNTSAGGSIASSPMSPSCVTPPSSPTSARSSDPNNHYSLPTTNGLNLLKQFWNHWKPQGMNDNENYFYMDEQAQERRARAQASNVIAPVSF